MATTNNPPDRILLIFKTHLDLGFTDLAENVRRQYLTTYIPAALSLAQETRQSPHRFRWSVGSWLLEEYRAAAGDSQELEEAIRQGDIRWHALPFTTHTEYMSPGLLDYGLSISQRLDRRYGKKTIAAKLTDVPGHTVAMVPHLAKAGVRFLHIGVNPTSTVPQIPPLFWWQAPDGSQILVMYNSNYGEMTAIGDSGTAVYFAHTGDNHGPQSAEEIHQLYERLQAQYPGADLRAATLEDVAEAALAQKDLPVVTGEIGDSWIHGTGTDPAKTSAYRALLRLGENLPPAEQEALYDALLPVPEHTWGLDEKTHLSETYFENFQGEYDCFIRRDFEAARKMPRFQLMEASWQEQRDYVRQAARAIGTEVPATSRRSTDPEDWEPLTRQTGLHLGGFTVSVGGDGRLCGLLHGDRVWADETHPLGSLRYEVFSQTEYDRFRAQYVTSDEDWAIEDFGKIGVEKANDRFRAYRPKLQGVYRKGNALLFRGTFEGEAWERFGGPARVETVYEFGENQIQVDFAWFDKPASRIPEAIWLEFSPMANLTAIHKLDSWLSPFRVEKGGNRRMHVTQKGVAWNGAQIECLDTGLVSLGDPTLLQFEDTLPEQDAGAWFCLYNNIWGTNFPMWYDEDARFRFVLAFGNETSFI